MAKKQTSRPRASAAPRGRTRRAAKATKKKISRKSTARSTGRGVSRSAASRAVEDTLQVTFELRDVAGQLVTDPEARFTFRQLSDNRQIGPQVKAALRAGPRVFQLPAKVGDAVVCEYDLLGYRFARSPIFFRTPGAPVSKQSQLFREPDQWTPAFTPWANLGAAFAALREVLEASTDVAVFKKGLPEDQVVPGHLATMSGDAYDALPASIALARTALLNTCHALNTTMEPVSDARSWFSFVSRLVAIGRERFLAFVDPQMEVLVRQISEHIEDFRADYERTPAENHRGNVPADLQPRITGMVSIKSTAKKGNFQLTLTHLAGQAGAPDEVLLDADIDENGTLLGHLFDLFKHKISGGTHPNDIHEILTWLHHQATTPGPFDLGYKLQPRT